MYSFQDEVPVIFVKLMEDADNKEKCQGRTGYLVPGSGENLRHVQNLPGA
jgi:hypothetical protein